MGWEFGISRCKLLYTEQIHNKGLLYSTRNSVQYPVINHNRKHEVEYVNIELNQQKFKKIYFYWRILASQCC